MGKFDAAKSAQLGMPVSTARSRLVKLIMFDLAKRLDETKCFRCGVDIQSVDDLSIEHKEPWLNVSTELFWDLNNIAFSHLQCNSFDGFLNSGIAKPKYSSEEERQSAIKASNAKWRKTESGRAANKKYYRRWYDQQRSDPEKWERYKASKRTSVTANEGHA
jgi:hypothetical protein